MLLINENLAVSRIINLISHKENLEVEEFENLNSVIKDRYEFILIDNDSYKEGMISEIKGRFKYKKLIFIAPKNGGKPLGFDEILFKPFLPIDFLKVVDKFMTSKNQMQPLESLKKEVKEQKKEEYKVVTHESKEKVIENSLKEPTIDTENIITNNNNPLPKEEVSPLEKLAIIKESISKESFKKDDLAKESLKNEIKSTIENGAKKSIESIISNNQLREVLEELEINIKISFNFNKKSRE